MGRGTLCAIAAVACATAAHGSYDLLMLLDAGTGGGTGGVHRYDPMTGAYFGRFAYGWTDSALDLAVNKNNGEAYILENRDTSNDRVLVFDYSTGNFKRMFSVGSNAVRLATASNGDLLFAGWDNLGSIRRVSNTGVWQRNYSGSLAAPSTGVAEVNGRVVSFVAGQGILGWVPDTGGPIAASLSSYFATTSNSTSVGNTFVYGLSSGVLAGAPVSAASIGFAGVVNNTGLQVSAVAGGHDSMVFAGVDTGTSTTVYRAPITGGSYGSFVAPQVAQVVGAVNVVAPEPASLVAMAAGLGLLMRRKRRRG